ncbi:helix-turn-helix domain-containing protein [Secundilactobacillus mixtipabuli]|nr:helix-turn-helix transcriptional regulator [Secundilactobacillus mixtipabuli]
MMKFAEQLKTLRTALHLSQDDLAAQLFVSRQAVSKWENGDGTPDLKTLVKLAEVLNVSLDTLVLGTKPANGDHIDSSVFVYNPTTGLYERRRGVMNFWDFLAQYWWTVIALITIIGIFFF